MLTGCYITQCVLGATTALDATAAAGVTAGVVGSAVAAIALWLTRRVRKEDRARGRWQQFHYKCARLGLGEQEENVLKAIARSYFRDTPGVIVSDRAAFEKGVALLAGAAGRSDVDSLAQIERIIANIRRCLRFDAEPAGLGLLSTRQFTPGMKVEIVDRSNNQSINARVSEVGELHFSIDLDEDASTLSEDSVVSARIPGGRSVWEFETRVLGTWEDVIRFAHNDSPAETDRRVLHRAMFETEVAYVTLPVPITEQRTMGVSFKKASVIDISARGLGVRSATTVEVDVKLLLCLSLKQHAPAPLWCVGEVQRCTPSEDGGFFVGIQLSSLSEDEEALLVRLVNERDRKAAARTPARSLV